MTTDVDANDVVTGEQTATQRRTDVRADGEPVGGDPDPGQPTRALAERRGNGVSTSGGGSRRAKPKPGSSYRVLQRRM